MNLLLATIVSYQIASGLPLKHDGYVVERDGDGLVVKAETARAFLYANYESNRWMHASRYPFVRDPHFKFRALDVSRSPEPLREWIAATGANAVYLKRGRPDAKRLKACAELGVRDLWLVQRDPEWRRRNRPGHWNMPCPLRLGMMGGWEGNDHPMHPTRLDRHEQRSHMSLWCLWASPIIIGAPIDSLDEFTLSLLTNDEMLAVNQDPLGIQAEEFEVPGGEALVKRLEDGDVAVGLFNVSDAEGERTVAFDLAKAGLSGPQHVRDLWERHDLPDAAGSFSTPVPRHGCVVVRFAPAQ